MTEDTKQEQDRPIRVVVVRDTVELRIPAPGARRLTVPFTRQEAAELGRALIGAAASKPRDRAEGLDS